MTADQQRDLKRRASAVLRAPIPPCVRNGSANAAADYKDAAAICAGFVQRGGVKLLRVSTAVSRLESMQARA